MKTLQSRLDDQATTNEGNAQLGEAERKNLQERAEQAEDRALTVSYRQRTFNSNIFSLLLKLKN